MATGTVYSYDSLGRLTSATFNDGAKASYNYDNEGNRTSVVEVAVSTGVTVAALPKVLGGSFPNNPMVVMISTGKLIGWGDSTTGALADGVSAPQSAPAQDVLFDPNTTIPPSSATIVDWAFVNANLYVVFSNGWVYSAGANDYGQLGQGDTVNRPFLKRIEYFVTNGLSIKTVWAAGSGSATNGGGCVYLQASDNSMYACGANSAGNLGNASTPTSNVSTPAPCSGIGHTSNYVVDVQVCGSHDNFSAYMLFNDSTLMVAGYNAQGQLGTGNTTNVSGSFVSAKVTGGTNVSNFVSLSCQGGNNHGNAIAVDKGGNVWGTGWNADGELGLGSTANQTLFTQAVGLSNIVDAKIGGGEHGYAYALDKSGVLYTWGSNVSNNLFRNNTISPVTTPSAAPYTPGVIAKVFLPRSDDLETNAAQLIVLTSNGLLAYAGESNGQLGIANTANPGAYIVVPSPISFLNGSESIASIFIHGYKTTQRWFVLTAAGNLYSLGSNENSICTGGLASDSEAPNVAWYKFCPSCN